MSFDDASGSDGGCVIPVRCERVAVVVGVEFFQKDGGDQWEAYARVCSSLGKDS